MTETPEQLLMEAASVTLSAHEKETTRQALVAFIQNTAAHTTAPMPEIAPEQLSQAAPTAS